MIVTQPNRNASPRLPVIGLFPPPVHGQSVLTEKIAALFAQDFDVQRIQLSGTNAVGKLLAAAKACLRALTFRGVRRIYGTPPGQLGLWFFVPIVAALRLRGMTLFLHHHSFRPVNAGPLPAMRMIAWIGGSSLRHILLGERMREGFERLYPGSGGNLVLANAFAYPPPEMPAPRQGPVVLGHLSVMTRDKGVARILGIFDALREKGLDARLELAGPVADQTLQPLLDDAVRRHGAALRLHGPVSGAAKGQFYKGIDIFLLPSTLVDEADPLVIQEAYEHGAEVMASDRGCILERLRRPEAILTNLVEQDAPRVATMIEDVAARREAVAQENWRHAGNLHALGLRQMQALVDALRGV
jgi:glycosyltransferase involved in cell wall biosynthesis